MSVPVTENPAEPAPCNESPLVLTRETESETESESESVGDMSAIRVGRRVNHYELAFQAYVRSWGLPCVAVDQTRRAREGRAMGLKNPDYLLYRMGQLHLIIEVKGKRARNTQGHFHWENWVTVADLDSLARWRTMYGPGFEALLVFVYADLPETVPLPDGNGAFHLPPHDYRFWAVALDAYLAHLRSRGPAWKAVAMERCAFRRRVRPLSEWLALSQDAHNPVPPPQPRSTRARIRRRLRRISAPDIDVNTGHILNNNAESITEKEAHSQ